MDDKLTTYSITPPGNGTKYFFKPFVWNQTDEYLSRQMSDSDWITAERETEKYNSAITSHKQAMMAEMNKIKTALQGLLSGAELETAQNWLTTQLEKELTKLPPKLDLDVLKNKQKKIKNEKETLLAQAVEFVAKRGKTLGCDYTLENVIQVANDLRYEELIAEKVANNTDILFDANTNCDDYGNVCGGWDGESRRCECGNRRVYWERNGDFRDMTIYPMPW